MPHNEVASADLQRKDEELVSLKGLFPARTHRGRKAFPFDTSLSPNLHWTHFHISHIHEIWKKRFPTGSPPLAIRSGWSCSGS